MDSQGAAFAFDMNMDFSNVFTMKPNEDNTSCGFFGDEGIDATTGFSQGFDLLNPLLNTTPQEQTYMPQLTMDDTSGSIPMWNGQLTPQSQNALNSFPPTPLQSFDTLYEQPSTLGKRALQLDMDDFPQAKRHETVDYSNMFSPSSSWTLDAQQTPPSAATFGLSDEAADMCAMWFNKYAILPSDRHITSLSQLTGEPAEAIRHWFGRMLKQGMGSSSGDSAYKSQTAMVQQDAFWSTDIMQVPQLASGESTQEAISTPEVTPASETTTVVKPSNALRSGKKQRCSPTDDRSLLSRDPEKIYQCTRKCGKRYGRKCDWKRNEEEGYPCKSWVCSLCTSEGAENVKPCFRKYHFAQHFRNIHPGLNCDDYEETSIVASETEFPRQCGFCKHRFESRQERIDHIADHFKQGKCMLDWNENGGDNNNDSDNNDDDDDSSGGDGSSGTGPPYQPPQYDPSGSNSRFFGGGSSDGGSNGSGPQGGFFQFQLSQRNSCGSISSSMSKSHSKQQIIAGGDLQRFERGLRASSEPLLHRSTEDFGEPEEDVPPEPGRAEGHDKDALAGDAVSKAVTAMDEVHGLYYGNRTDVLLNQTSKDETPVHTRSSLNKPLQTLTDTGKALSVEIRESQTSPATLPLATIKVAEETTQGLQSLKDAVEIAATCRSLVLSKSASTIEPTPLGQQVHFHGTPVATSKTLTIMQILQTIPTTSQSFLSLKLLGAGGFSTVDEVIHRATNLRLGRKTLKNRDQAALKELQKEVSVLQKLRHPHVIRFLGAYSKGDKMSILVSPVADTTLALWLDRISTQQPANLAQMITGMFGCLASSVRYLHEQRPVVKHMDIKPQNILIVEGQGEFPHVVLCDFGISSAEEMKQEEAQPLTRQYVAPEVVEGLSRTQAADIWSLGCVFTEMAAAPFGKTNSSWLKLRNEFSGKTGKYYWQDVSGLQDRLSVLLEEAATSTEMTAVSAIKTMLHAEPAERPDAGLLTLVFTPAPCCLDWPNDKAAYPGPREEFSSAEGLLPEGHVRFGQFHQCAASDEDNRHDLANAKSWLEQCSHTHDACAHTSAAHAKTLPTRLIDINPSGQDSSYIRLVDSATLLSDAKESVDYVALSHVWQKSDVSLTSDRLEAMQANLPLELLSATLNAAIAAAQGLGVRYIWVDSLCVLQDSQQDKQHECANMASVFRNAAVTLILDQIDDGLDANTTTTQNSSIAATTTKSTPTDRLTASAALPALSYNTPGFAWDTRAWALQERLLSPRFLHLGREQMYWECNGLKASDTFPQGLPSLTWEKVHRKIDTDSESQRNEKVAMSVIKRNVGHTVAADGARVDRTDYAKKLGPKRMRDVQWIRRQGDAADANNDVRMLDVNVNAKNTISVAANEGTDPTNDDHVNTSFSEHGQLTDAAAKNITLKRNLKTRFARLRFSTRNGKDAEVSAVGKSAEEDICTSGQMDRRGSSDEMSVDRDRNASGNRNGEEVLDGKMD